MSGVRHFKKNEMEFSAFGGPPGEAKIARLVGPDMSKTIGAGIATFDGCSVEWTVLYDEMVVVLDGHFRLRVGSEVELVVEPLNTDEDGTELLVWRWRPVTELGEEADQ